jgi:hypothetical protein
VPIEQHDARRRQRILARMRQRGMNAPNTKSGSAEHLLDLLFARQVLSS